MNARQFSDLYSEHYGKLHYLILGMVKISAIAEDVTSRAWMTAWERRGLSTGNFKAWVYQIAVHQAVEYLRRPPANHSENLDDHLDIQDPHDFAQELERYQEYKRAALVAEQLNRRLREALDCHLKGLTITQAARVMRVTPSTAGTRIWAAKAKVRQLCAA